MQIMWQSPQFCCVRLKVQKELLLSLKIMRFCMGGNGKAQFLEIIKSAQQNTI